MYLSLVVPPMFMPVPGVHVTPSGLVREAPFDNPEITRKIPRSGDHVMQVHAAEVGNVTDVQFIPSGLVAALVVLRAPDCAVWIAPATAQNMPSSGDHVTDDQYVAVPGMVRAVHVTPSGLVAATVDVRL